MSALAGLSFIAAPAWADDRADAEDQFRAGVALQKIEDFEAAIAAYEASLRLFPTRGALFNLANCLKAERRYAEALQAFNTLRRNHGSELDGTMRRAVDEQVAELSRLTGSLTLEVQPAGAEVYVDGQLVGQSPLAAAMTLTPGQHVIEARSAGFEDRRVIVEVHAGRAAARSLVLEPAAPATSGGTNPPESSPRQPYPVAPVAGHSPAPGPENPRSDAERGTNTLAWTATGVGAGLLACGAGVGIWALALDDSLEEECVDGHCPANRAADIDRLSTLTVASNVLLGAGAVLSASGLVVLLLEGSDQQSTSAGHSFDLTAGPRVFGASYQQRF